MATSYCALVRVCGAFTHQKLYSVSRHCGVSTHIWSVRTLGSGERGENGSTKDTPEFHAQRPDLSAQGPAFGGMMSRRRHLSPLERISRLLPQETLSEEVWELRGGKPKEQQIVDSAELSQETSAVGSEGSQGDQRQSCSMGGLMMEGSSDKDEGASAQGSTDSPPAPPRELPLRLGELVLAEYRGRGWQEFRKMFQLQEKGLLQSAWGCIAHSAIVGSQSGSVLSLSGGAPVVLRRPSLEEYVLLMKRAPAIAYPKDATAMLMMMDVSEGDSVLESGSGSGAMTLFLSRAVGSRGSVLSLELRKDHHLRAVRNYERWRKAWSLRRGEDWPDNVCFYTADLKAAAPILSGRSFHSVALDMISPQLVLATVFPHLHDGAVCAVYLVNLTQVIDLLEGVRTSGLPLQCERIIEVQHRDWLVAPAVTKDGKAAVRVAPPAGGCGEEEGQMFGEGGEEEGHFCSQETESLSCEERAPFGTVTYMVRPHHQQVAHTAFLVKLRKVVPSS